MEIDICRDVDFDWDEFVDGSPQGTIFQRSEVLKSYGDDVRYLLCRKGHEIIAAMPVVEDQNGTVARRYQQYTGIIFNNRADKKTVAQVQTEFDASIVLADFLFQQYKELYVAHHWSVTDMRPFQWVNFNEREQGFFDVTIDYTSLLNLDDPNDISGWRKSRRSCLAKAKRYDIKTVETDDLGILIKLLDQTYARQGEVFSEPNNKALERLHRHLFPAGKGKMYVAYLDGVPVSAALFAYDSKRAYYVFGASDPEFRSTEVGTKLLYDTFHELHKTAGIREVDLVGVNSPQRGSFKLSFGGILVPHFMVRKIGGNA